MRSMTGYGKGIAAKDGREIVVELKSVNHRFLDLGLKLPRGVAHTEDLFRAKLAERLARGHIDVFVHYSNTREDARTVTIDTALLSAYVTAAHAVNATLALPDDLTLCAALNLPDVTTLKLNDDDGDAVSLLATEALDAATDALIVMRESEGARLRNDLSARLFALGDILSEIKLMTENVVPIFKARLEARIAELAGDVPLDPARLATEVAIFADKASVDEEITRIGIHLEHAESFLTQHEPAGRKLDFLVQELNREFNTIGSKVNDAKLTALVLTAKSEIEKLREQIQNVE